MKLTAFRIRNFKSVIDSGWKNLSPDNISSLIGQNESGKTSVLSALLSFRTAVINENAFRSDDTLPIIECSFSVNDDEISLLGDDVPKELKDILKSEGRVNLTRAWTNRKTSTLDFEKGKIVDYFNQVKPIPAVPVIEKKDVVETVSEADETGAVAEDVVEIEKEKPAEEAIVEITKPTISKEEFLKRVLLKLPEFRLFESYGSILPDRMDIKDITAKKQTPGHKGVQNFLEIAGLDIESLDMESSGTERFRRNKIDTINRTLTADFREFWRQTIGGTNKIELELQVEKYGQEEPEKLGDAYLIFWVRDGSETLHPSQRSEGVRWFLSFYLELKANKKKQNKDNVQNLVLLIDEPGISLHAKAQEDVLDVLEDLPDSIQTIYTTHSPFLLQKKKIYRILGIERVNAEDEKSPTIIHDSLSLGAASSDTLTPLFALIGVDFSNQDVIKESNNVILEEPSAYYYFIAFAELLKLPELNYIPATGADNIDYFCYTFTGWNIDFVALFDDDSKGRTVYNRIKKNLYGDKDDISAKHLMKMKDSNGVEDLFTPGDFKKIVGTEAAHNEGESNSALAKRLNLQKALTAINFYNDVQSKKIKETDLTKTTKDNFTKLITELSTLLKRD
ncbi:MAG: AAA family ATPase [Candidatus Pacebacteria bacterium]|nr:AAA family ATPase [Candidatus Paceibacterota bacterium]